MLLILRIELRYIIDKTNERGFYTTDERRRYQYMFDVYKERGGNGEIERDFLKLDSSKLKKTFGWKPTWHIDETIDRICEWNRVWFADGNIPEIMDKQIADFLK